MQHSIRSLQGSSLFNRSIFTCVYLWSRLHLTLRVNAKQRQTRLWLPDFKTLLKISNCIVEELKSNISVGIIGLSFLNNMDLSLLEYCKMLLEWNVDSILRTQTNQRVFKTTVYRAFRSFVFTKLFFIIWTFSLLRSVGTFSKMRKETYNLKRRNC